MVDPGAVDPQAGQPGPALQPRRVHGPVPVLLFPRTQALHRLQPGLHLCRVSDLLVGLRQLPVLERRRGLWRFDLQQQSTIADRK